MHPLHDYLAGQPAVKAALKSLMDATVTSGGGKKSRKVKSHA